MTNEFSGLQSQHWSLGLGHWGLDIRTQVEDFAALLSLFIAKRIDQWYIRRCTFP